MQILILYVVTVVVFLAVDAVGLKFLLRPLFERHIPDLLAEDLKLAPAALFYLFYIAVLLWFVSVPNLAEGRLMAVALNAALFGAAAYGTYEFTNLATLKGWSWEQVAVDVTWGACLSAFAAVAGVWITRSLTT